MTTIHARPERTTTEITADEQAATAFWTGLPRRNPHLQRLIERESHDSKLLMADKEGREWARRHEASKNLGNRNARRAARLAADPLANRQDQNLRPYVHPDTRNELPRTALHGREKGERVRSLARTSTWFRELPNWNAQRVARLQRESAVVFEHWLLEHPQYGPLREGPDLFAHTLQHWNYIPGQIRPAGMTPERALQIAITVLDDHNGVWPDAPPQLL